MGEKKVTLWKGSWGREDCGKGAGERQSLHCARAPGADGRVRSRVGLRKPGQHPVSCFLWQEFSHAPAPHLGSRPASQGLEAASYVTYLQKETSGIAMAAEGFMMMSGLGFGAERLGLLWRRCGECMLFYHFSRKWRSAP